MLFVCPCSSISIASRICSSHTLAQHLSPRTLWSRALSSFDASHSSALSCTLSLVFPRLCALGARILRPASFFPCSSLQRLLRRHTDRYLSISHSHIVSPPPPLHSFVFSLIPHLPLSLARADTCCYSTPDTASHPSPPSVPTSPKTHIHISFWHSIARTPSIPTSTITNPHTLERSKHSRVFSFTTTPLPIYCSTTPTPHSDFSLPSTTSP